MQFPQHADSRTIQDIYSQPIGSEFDVQSLYVNPGGVRNTVVV
jgi:hypothetical protein